MSKGLEERTAAISAAIEDEEKEVEEGSLTK